MFPPTVIFSILLISPYVAISIYDPQFLFSQKCWYLKILRLALTVSAIYIGITNLLASGHSQTSWAVIVVTSFVFYLTDTVPVVRKLFS